MQVRSRFSGWANAPRRCSRPRPAPYRLPIITGLAGAAGFAAALVSGAAHGSPGEDPVPAPPASMVDTGAAVTTTPPPAMPRGVTAVDAAAAVTPILPTVSESVAIAPLPLPSAGGVVAHVPAPTLRASVPAGLDPAGGLPADVLQAGVLSAGVLPAGVVGLPSIRAYGGMPELAADAMAGTPTVGPATLDAATLDAATLGPATLDAATVGAASLRPATVPAGGARAAMRAPIDPPDDDPGAVPVGPPATYPADRLRAGTPGTSFAASTPGEHSPDDVTAGRWHGPDRFAVRSAVLPAPTFTRSVGPDPPAG